MSDYLCICFLDPGHGPTRHECACGNRWSVGEASPDCTRWSVATAPLPAQEDK